MDWGFFLLFFIIFGFSGNTAVSFSHKGKVREAHFVRPSARTLAEYLERRDLEMSSKERLNKIQIYFEFVKKGKVIQVYPYLRTPWLSAPKPLSFSKDLSMGEVRVIENATSKIATTHLNNEVLSIESASLNPLTRLELNARFRNQSIRVTVRSGDIP